VAIQTKVQTIRVVRPHFLGSAHQSEIAGSGRRSVTLPWKANQLGLNEEGLLFTCEDDFEEKFLMEDFETSRSRVFTTRRRGSRSIRFIP
jgi:hypothetical protein